MILFCVIDGAAFADKMYFDLSGIFQLVFDLLGNVSCEKHHLIIVDDVRFHADTNFASCLDGKAIIDALKGVRDLFQFFQTFDIVFEVLSSGTGTCSGGGYGSRMKSRGSRGW